ncbi:hypothetical protein PLICRDRAFT_109188 [Plicaturopsis crispa FD-325 SS-3]|nr:hypothetical protein PLICRDRAFT_109188 [Plicaturopsis crispa FD-325 SS-3]
MRGAYTDESVASVAIRCQMITTRDVGVNFLLMVNYMQLVTKFQSTMKRLGTTSVASVYNAEVAGVKSAPSYRSVSAWYAMGSKFAAIAAGGSIYALMLVAGLNLRTSIAGCDTNMPWALANCLRAPTHDTPSGNLTINRIIPTIARLRSLLPLHMASMFSPILLQDLCLPANIDCTNMDASDRFFESFKLHTFKPVERDTIAWGACYTSLPSTSSLPTHGLTHAVLASNATECYSPPLTDALNHGSTTPPLAPTPTPRILSPLPTTPHLPSFSDTPHSTVIHTSFDAHASSNKRFPAERDRDKNLQWTDCERGKVERSVACSDIDSFESKLASHYKNGVRIDDKYIRISTEDIPNQIVNVRDSNDDLLAFICTTMPESMRQNLTANLMACFAPHQSLIPTDSRDAEKFTFETLHFSWYNRHCTKGSSAPTDIHPYQMERDGARTNHGQFIPYPSKEMKDHESIYARLKVIFDEVFEWISSELSAHLKDEYEILCQVADVIPGNNRPAGYPFLSVVINLNVQTKAHRDGIDKIMCLVLPIGNHEGGDLCLFEPGIAVKCREGDFMAFPSHRITHFNMHYRGLRASIVLHTDREMDRWVSEGRNGWSNNAAFH